LCDPKIVQAIVAEKFRQSSSINGVSRCSQPYGGVIHMKKNAKRTSSASTSRAPRRRELLGPPPILEGETEKAYYELLERVFTALKPVDFIEEIWARDIVDVVWNLYRLRRMLSAFLAAEVWDDANDKASSLVEADPELMNGTEEQKQEMARLLNPSSNSNWEAQKAQYPRATERYMKLWEAAWSTLDLNEIQANVMIDKIDTIERIEALIMLAERRFDSVIRELDRHRMMQNLRYDLHRVEKVKIKSVGPK
jgi:hypothetical protein